MSIKTINRIYDNIKDFDPDDLASATKTVMPIVEEFSRNSDVAEKLIMESISEKVENRTKPIVFHVPILLPENRMCVTNSL